MDNRVQMPVNGQSQLLLRRDDIRRIAKSLMGLPDWADGSRTLIMELLLYDAPDGPRLAQRLYLKGAPEGAAMSAVLEVQKAGTAADGRTYLGHLVKALADDSLDTNEKQFLSKLVFSEFGGPAGSAPHRIPFIITIPPDVDDARAVEQDIRQRIMEVTRNTRARIDFVQAESTDIVIQTTPDEAERLKIALDTGELSTIAGFEVSGWTADAAAEPIYLRRVIGPPTPEGLCAYWLESTASLEIPGNGPELAPLTREQATAARKQEIRLEAGSWQKLSATTQVDRQIEAIATELLRRKAASTATDADDKTADLVVGIHGYNNPTYRAIEWQKNLIVALANDSALGRKVTGEDDWHGPVCLGYHWPSEQMPDPVRERDATTGLLLPSDTPGAKLARMLLSLSGLGAVGLIVASLWRPDWAHGWDLLGLIVLVMGLFPLLLKGQQLNLFRASPRLVKILGAAPPIIGLVAALYIALPTDQVIWALLPLVPFALLLGILGALGWMRPLIAGGGVVLIGVLMLICQRFYAAKLYNHGDLFIAGVLVTVGMLLAAVSIGPAILRASAYFRDVFRATQYGTPDLVAFFQKLDATLERLGASEKTVSPVRVAFIGHSMGGYVLTSVVRVLSDVFEVNRDPDQADAKWVVRKSGKVTREEGANYRPSGVGKHLLLERLVLVSPDIPAEALNQNRANFLASSLRRFSEAYLFSNAGDEVLRAISTIVNYLSYPAAQAKFGMRLGNVAVRKPRGQYTVAEDVTWSDRDDPESGDIMVDAKSLEWLIEQSNGSHMLAEYFTYVDCTGFVDGDPRNRFLTDNKTPSVDSKQSLLTTGDHARLMLKYLVGPAEPGTGRNVDGHSGYFLPLKDGDREIPNACLKLMLRFACLGWDKTVEAYRGELPNDPERPLDVLAKDHGMKIVEGFRRVRRAASSETKTPMD